MHDFTAQITLLPAGEGRRSSANKDWRPIITIGESNLCCRMISKDDDFPLDATTTADVTLLSPEFLADFAPGTEFTIRELRVVGQGVVTILNDQPTPCPANLSIDEHAQNEANRLGETMLVYIGDRGDKPIKVFHPTKHGESGEHTTCDKEER